MSKSAISFHRRFRSEEVCIEFLERVRWNGEPVCPRCGCLRCYSCKTRKNYLCAGCRRTFTVRNGTIFEDSKLPLQTWFTAVWLVTTAKAGVSSIELSEKLGISQKSAWFVLHRIQYVASYSGNSKPLSGNVEMDDMEASRKGGKKTHVVGMVERQGDATMTVVESVDRKTVTELLEQHVENGSKLNTDDFPTYRNLPGYDHASVQHTKGEYVRGEVHTNTVEGMFGNFGRRLKGVHIHVSEKHLQKYCDAYAYRYNARDLDPIERFEIWFRHVVNRLTYKTLTA